MVGQEAEKKEEGRRPRHLVGWRAPEDRGKGGTKKEVIMKSGNAAKPAPQLTLQLRRVSVAGRSLEQV